jgi:hypothetical protein
MLYSPPMQLVPGYLSTEAAFWTELPPPPEVSPIWIRLHVSRALLDQAFTTVASEPNFLTYRNSPRLTDRMATAALESDARQVFDLLLDLTRELVVGRTITPVRRAHLRALSAYGILDEARAARLLSNDSYAILERVRLINVVLAAQHASGLTWQQIALLQSGTARIMGDLQAGFAKLGVSLPLVWPA